MKFNIGEQVTVDGEGCYTIKGMTTHLDTRVTEYDLGGMIVDESRLAYAFCDDMGNYYEPNPEEWF